MPQINPALSRFGKWAKRGKKMPSVSTMASQCKHFSLHAIVTFPKALYVLESLPYGLYLSLPPSLPPSLISSLPPLSIHPSLPPSATPNPPSPCMCYSNIAARTQCFSMPQDRQSITAWLSLSIGSEPLLAQP